MNRFVGAKGLTRWLVLVFVAGLAVGILLGRIAGRGVAGDLLTALALITVGLAGSVALVLIGWFFGRQGPVPAPSEPTAVSAPVQEIPAAGGHQESPGLKADAFAAQLVEPELIPTNARVSWARGRGKWMLRFRNFLGYESLQFSVGLNQAWFAHVSTPEGRREMTREFSLSLGRAETTGWVLFLAALAIYALTRLWALDQFPINFFADEANQVLQAVDLVKRGFRDPQGGFFPMYFKLFTFYYPDISVYFHVVTASLFGKSIVVARASSALVTVAAVGGLALAMKQVFRARSWWAVILLLAMTPAWFLFSRTTFDTAGMSSLYALFIACYLFYRYRSPRFIYLALVFAAATFYAYPSGQAAIGLLALFLLISDWRYHWQQRRLWPQAILLIALLAIPFVQFEVFHPSEAGYHLRAVNSYWVQNIPLAEKLSRAVTSYLDMLSPAYWFLPDQHELIRHQMKGYGFLPLIELPLLLIGVVLCVRFFKESRYRTGLVALLVAPVGVTVAEPAIIRSLVFVIPAGFVSALGLEWLLNLVKTTRAAAVTTLAVFVVLSAMSLGLMQDALVNGPTWFSDYTLYGMQWGAKQLFQDTVPQLVESNPDATIYVSDTWANGTDVFLRFFDVDSAHVQMASINGWIEKKRALEPGSLFVMPPDEYEKVQASPKFQNVQVDNTISYPDGREGFYIVQLEYADNVDQVFAQERAALEQPVTEAVVIDGQTVELSHTKFDIGKAADMFDGDPLTVARAVEANPAVLDFKFPTPRTIHGLSAYLGRSNVQVTAHLYASAGAQPVDYTASFRYGEVSTELPAGPLAQMNFDNGPGAVSRLVLELAYPEVDETAHAHIFELKFR